MMQEITINIQNARIVKRFPAIGMGERQRQRWKDRTAQEVGREVERGNFRIFF